MAVMKVFEEKTVDCIGDMVTSMEQALANAHGYPLLLKDLEQMKVWDFIKLYAPNGIRFVYDRKKVVGNDVK